MSAFGGKADIAFSWAECLLLSQSGNRSSGELLAVQPYAATIAQKIQSWRDNKAHARLQAARELV